METEVTNPIDKFNLSLMKKTDWGTSLTGGNYIKYKKIQRLKPTRN